MDFGDRKRSASVSTGPSKEALGDMRENLANAAQTANARVQAAQSEGGSLLTVPITGADGKVRKQTTISEPHHWMLLSQAPRDAPTVPGKRGAFYSQIVQPIGPNQAPEVTGRVQDPQTRRAPDDERYSYTANERKPPSYPTDAAHLKAIGKTHDMSSSDLFNEVLDIASGKSPSKDFTQQERAQLASPMMINNVSEQRRSPAMALFSAQTLDLASRPGSGLTPDQVYGTRRGRKNLPGKAPATGTGAKKVWKQGVEPALGDPTRVLTPEQQTVMDNAMATHKAMMEEHYDPATEERLRSEGFGEEFINTSQRVHMTSFALRRASTATGQLQYNLRTRVSPGVTSQMIDASKQRRRADVKASQKDAAFERLMQKRGRSGGKEPMSDDE